MRNIVIILFSFVCGLTFAQTNIYFKSGSYNVDAKERETLRRLAVNLSGKSVAVFVQGYADTTGTIEKNRNLARNREKAVIAILSEKGINTAQIATPCTQKALSNNDLSNPENRRVSITVDKLVSYPAKDGWEVLAPQSISLRLVEHYYQPNYSANGYRNKKCQLPLPKGRWYTDIELAKIPTDSCHFIIVKRPIPVSNHILPVLYHWIGKYQGLLEKGFESYTSDEKYEFVRVPIFSNYIKLDQSLLCGLYVTTYLKIILPKNIRPIKASLMDKCITVPAEFKKDTLRVEFNRDAQIYWQQLNLSIKTRDAIYSIPMSDFDEISKEKYSGGIYTLAFRESQNNLNIIPNTEKQPAKKRRTFWQRIGDFFR